MKDILRGEKHMKKRLAFILVAFGILGFSLGNEVLAADTAPASATMATDSDVSFYNGELLKNIWSKVVIDCILIMTRLFKIRFLMV